VLYTLPPNDRYHATHSLLRSTILLIDPTMRANRDTAKDTFEALDEGMSRLQAQIDQLQAQMHQLQTEKRALCARRNKLAPLCQLPADVLYHIIDLAVHAGYRYNNGYDRFAPLQSFYGPATNWARVTHVCAYMRQVAITSPLLWSCIDLNWHPAWAQLAYERSLATPLSVSVSDPPKVVEHMTPMMLRSEAITIQVDSHADTAAQREYASMACAILERSSPPSLRSLCFAPGTTYSFTLSSRFLQGQTSSLTRLMLWQISFDPSARTLHFPCLILLDVQGLGSESQSQYLAPFLTGCPQLEVLYLEDMGFDELDLMHHDVPQLPHLRVISIWDCASSLLVSLSLFPIPQQERYFTCQGVDIANMELHMELWQRVTSLAKVDVGIAPLLVTLVDDDKDSAVTDGYRYHLDFLSQQAVPWISLVHSTQDRESRSVLMERLAAEGVRIASGAQDSEDPEATP
jgi:hypothetical protein